MLSEGEAILGLKQVVVDLATNCDGMPSPIPEIETFYTQQSGVYRRSHSPVMNLSVAVSGTKNVQVGEATGQIRSGSFVLMRGDTRYDATVTASSDDPYVALKVQLHPRLLAQALIEIAELRPDTKLSANTAPRLLVGQLDAGLTDLLIRLTTSAQDPWERRFMVPLQLKELVLRLAASGAATIFRDFASGDHEMIGRAIAFIDRNLDKQVSVDLIADELAISASAFSRRFRSVTNVSPMQFVKLARLGEARVRMIEGGLTIERAAFGVGYASVSHFSRDFRRHFGLSPGRYVERWPELGMKSAALGMAHKGRPA